MSPVEKNVVCALDAVKFKIMAPQGMWRSKERRARSVERGGAKIEINAGDLPSAGQCGGVCVYNHELTGHKRICTVIVFCT